LGLGQCGYGSNRFIESSNKKTVVDKDGQWKIYLDAMRASAVPAQLMIQSGKQTITLKIFWLVKYGFVQDSRTWNIPCGKTVK